MCNNFFFHKANIRYFKLIRYVFGLYFVYYYICSMVKSKFKIKKIVKNNTLKKNTNKLKRKKASNADYQTQEWKDLRQKVLERDGMKCTKCNDVKKLQCHHLYYTCGRLRYEYPLSALVTLCEKCHNSIHKVKRGGNFVISLKKAIELEGEEFTKELELKKSLLDTVVVKKNNERYINEKQELRERYLNLLWKY